MHTYVLASGRINNLMFVRGKSPNHVTVAQNLDRARHFESPAEALAFRAKMERNSGHWADANFIVYEDDGHLLHSLDV
jgi:hypothetical protein